MPDAHTARDEDNGFDAIEGVLLRLARGHDAALAPELTEAWRLTTAARGRLRVEDVAAPPVTPTVDAPPAQVWPTLRA